MYCTRPATRSPQAIRIVSRAPRRQASYYPSFPTASLMSPFFTRQSGSVDPFRGFERLIDDLTSTAFTPPQHFQLIRAQAQQQQQPFSPRFDIRENAESYELRGEIPGVEAQDLEVQFSDPQTLVIKGRTESQHKSSSDAPAAEAQAEPVQSVKGKVHETATTENAVVAETSDAASVHSTGSGSYKKPSVEDETEGFENIESAEAVDTPATTPAATSAPEQQQAITTEASQQTEAPQKQTQEQPQQQQGYYFVSERSAGSFQRVFKFQHRIEQEGVTASLKNGILSIVVPKAGVPEVRKIQVQ